MSTEKQRKHFEGLERDYVADVFGDQASCMSCANYGGGGRCGVYGSIPVDALDGEVCKDYVASNLMAK